MANKITRREALIGGSSALLLQGGCSTVSVDPAPGSSDIFQHGVASGDPGSDSVVIWTRVSSQSRSVVVDWQISNDETFADIVNQGRAETNSSRDYTVKVVADGLEPGKSYFYRFFVDRFASQTGRTRTLPTGHVEKLVLAVVTCSNYAFGYFNAYEVIARDSDVDCVLHLGDYIYEHGADAYGGETGRRLSRNHLPAHETISLDDYRQRHAQYKSDRSSQLMHARHPLVAIWDDHESANNPWMGGAQNHQEDEGSWEQRRADSLQAYFEWMPVRDPAAHTERSELWRHFKWGNLASLITLESRHTGRTEQISYGTDGDQLKSFEQGRQFMETVLGAADRHMLSERMEHFVQAELYESIHAGRHWRIIGNQSIMARRWAPNLRTADFDQLQHRFGTTEKRNFGVVANLGDLNLLNDLDSWNGYPMARERFYNLAKNAGAMDLLVLSGDSHRYWTNTLFDTEGTSMGLELGVTAVTSPCWPFPGMPEAQRAYDERLADHNKEVVWTSGGQKGFIRLELRQGSARADYVIVSTVESSVYDTEVIRSVEIENAGGVLTYT